MNTKERAPLPDSLSESSVDSEEISEEELLEAPESAEDESVDENHQMPEDDVEKQADKAESAKESKVLLESPKTFAGNVKERDEVDEDVVEDEAELERETKDGGDEDDELTVVEPEIQKNCTNDVEHQELGDQTGPLEPENDERESSAVNAENVPESDPTVRNGVWSSAETTDEPEASAEKLLSTTSPVLESPVLHSPFSNASMSPVEQLDVSGEPQEVSVSELQDLESSTEEPSGIVEVQSRFTIAPAWQRSLTSGDAQEQTQTISLVLPETNASNESPQTTELITPVQEEQPKAARAQSSPTLPVCKETPQLQEENLFGVRLRKTPVLHRYGLDGDSPWTPTQTESSGAQETPDHDQSSRKLILPKKPDLLADSVMSVRKIPGTSILQQLTVYKKDLVYYFVLFYSKDM